MLKKIFFLFFTSLLLNGSETSYEITPLIGYTFPNGGQQIRDHTVFAAEGQFNGFNTFLKPEFSLMYGDVDRNDEQVGDIDLFRSAINGVYEFENHHRITPLIKAGLGYEVMSDHHYDNQNGFFLNIGVGVKIALDKKLAFKLEAIEMQKYNASDWENNLVWMAGITLAFGQ